MTVTATAGVVNVVTKPPHDTLRATSMVAYAVMPESSAVRVTAQVTYVSTLQTVPRVLTTAVQYVAVKSVRFSRDAGLLQHPFFGELAVYILWEDYQPGKAKEIVASSHLDGSTREQRGKVPHVWRGSFVTYIKGKGPSGIADVNLLRRVWEQTIAFSLVDTTGNVYLADGPITFLWIGEFRPVYMGPNTEMIHIPFELVEV